MHVLFQTEILSLLIHLGYKKVILKIKKLTGHGGSHLLYNKITSSLRSVSSRSARYTVRPCLREQDTNK